MVVGVSYPLLGQTEKLIPFDDPHWFSSIWKFLQSVEASIHINKLHLPQSHRDSNVCIMDVIHDLPGLTRQQLRAFNRCQIFLGVHFLSKIVTADGSFLARDAWEGTRDRVYSLLWPYQPLPGPKSFRTWCRLLATAFLQGQAPNHRFNHSNFSWPVASLLRIVSVQLGVLLLRIHQPTVISLGE
jgi:hypothetical protein